jgi:hypothetical protein
MTLLHGCFFIKGWVHHKKITAGIILNTYYSRLGVDEIDINVGVHRTSWASSWTPCKLAAKYGHAEDFYHGGPQSPSIFLILDLYHEQHQCTPLTRHCDGESRCGGDILPSLPIKDKRPSKRLCKRAMEPVARSESASWLD